MSSIYSFQENSPVITTATTTGINQSDNLLIYSTNSGRTSMATVSALQAADYLPITTSTSTATSIPNQGVFVVTSATSVQFMLSTPTGVGQQVTLYNSSSTSTWQAVQTESTAVVIFTSGGTAGGSLSVQLTSSFQTVTLVSGVSSAGATGASWFVVNKSTGVAST